MHPTARRLLHFLRLTIAAALLTLSSGPQLVERVCVDEAAQVQVLRTRADDTQRRRIRSVLTDARRTSAGALTTHSAVRAAGVSDPPTDRLYLRNCALLC